MQRGSYLTGIVEVTNILRVASIKSARGFVGFNLAVDLLADCCFAGNGLLGLFFSPIVIPEASHEVSPAWPLASRGLP